MDHYGLQALKDDMLSFSSPTGQDGEQLLERLLALAFAAGFLVGCVFLGLVSTYTLVSWQSQDFSLPQGVFAITSSVIVLAFAILLRLVAGFAVSVHGSLPSLKPL